MSETKRKPVVGESFYMVGIARYNNWTGDVVVTRVGRKYFYIDFSYGEARFFIDTYKEDRGGYSATVRLYESKAVYDVEVNMGLLIEDIVKYFRYSNMNNNKLSIEQLTKISEIINA